jgi:GT2 family glycosyltransferase
MQLTAIVVNFNTADYTGRCLQSLQRASGVTRILVLDNGSNAHDVERVADDVRATRGAELIRLTTNLGFAGGCNVGIDAALADASCEAVLLLNSDAELQTDGAIRMTQALAAAQVGLAGGRVVKPSGAVDSLGIAFYVSCLASNRMVAGDRYFGPTGSCAVYRRELLQRLQQEHGHVFDPDFFCYAEDTDVAARALLLGYRPAYVEEIVATHSGQVSSGGGFSDFVLYHGIRNSIWMMLKCVPGPVLLLCSPLIALIHAGIVVRHGLKGKFKVLYSLYRDAVRGVPRMLRKRRAIQACRRIGSRAFLAFLTPRVYDADYLSAAVRDLFVHPVRRSDDR